MKISTFVSCSALFMASMVAAGAYDEPTRIDTCKMPGVVAYTFDDGPGPYNAALLATLKAKGVVASFFVIGEMVAQYGDALPKIMADGHQLASHTFNHRNLDSLSASEIQKEISDTSDIMFKYANVRPRYMRAPEGRCDSEVCKQTMKDLGLVVSHWNADTHDWKFTKSSDPVTDSMKEIRDRIGNSNPATDSFIILQHEIHKFSVDSLTAVLIDFVKSKGYRFVTMEECIGEKSYLDGSVVPPVVPPATGSSVLPTPSGVPGVPGTNSTGTAPVPTGTAPVVPPAAGTSPSASSKPSPSTPANKDSSAALNKATAWVLGMSAVVGFFML
ncbi:hypothetical protein BX616_006546 [Lobosporangium transversale]|uniref:NodB homology domain-containing protein n=1 Tax=Lobosporangium transversale TaxID=64571 RepID=A0A1Y2GU84_9FUNG|nr:hypothetical protein BCR41DRAFT_369516 [Lobosporangium transversale]KAF9896894.1 hypothetical protein BX616_006546 [Lobosporangium transversale]ORZ20914.1 hypothetical protein BCR41DRAFT_369516 [Lobosporangium transversale]|eukprot:XP_021882823.1 hypothetical protein BCR41DRAFT_369516 [Lobosporangium transversale]